MNSPVRDEVYASEATVEIILEADFETPAVQPSDGRSRSPRCKKRSLAAQRLASSFGAIDVKTFQMER